MKYIELYLNGRKEELEKEKNKEIRLKEKQIKQLKKKIKSLNEEIIEKQKEKKEQDILMGMLLEKINWKIIK